MKSKTKKPSKQRRRLFNAPQHRRGVVLSAHLSSELRQAHNANSIPVRAGDTVRVARGDYKGLEGKILRVDRKRYRVFVEGISRERADGTSVLVPVHPSKVEVLRLNLEDKWRDKILRRKGATGQAETVQEETHENVKATEEPKEPSTVMTEKQGGK